MKKLIATLLLLSGYALGQNANTMTIRFAGVPSGPCSVFMLGINNATSDLYDCSTASAWVLVSGGGGGGVTSFATRTGAVVPTAGDYGLSLIGNPAGGTTFAYALDQHSAWTFQGTGSFDITGRLNVSYSEAGTTFNPAGHFTMTENNSSNSSFGGTGLTADAFQTGNGNLADVAGIVTQFGNSGSGTIAAGYGLFIQSPTNSGGGAFTNRYGVYLKDLGVVGTGKNIAFAVAAQADANTWSFYGSNNRALMGPIYMGSEAAAIHDFGNGNPSASDPNGSLYVDEASAGALWERYNGAWQQVAGSNTTVTTLSTLTNCAAVGTAASPSVAACGAAPSGAFSCATNASAATCTINTTAVTANSRIIVQESAAEGTNLSVTCNTAPTVVPAILLSAKVAATSFTINMPTITVNPACFVYWVVN